MKVTSPGLIFKLKTLTGFSCDAIRGGVILMSYELLKGSSKLELLGGSSFEKCRYAELAASNVLTTSSFHVC